MRLLSAILLLAAATLNASAQQTVPQPQASDHGAGVAQFAPLVLPWAVKAAGGETRSSWRGMATSQGLSLAMMAGTVYSLKLIVNERRPDGSDTHSFPSGHSAWAYMGATMAAKELGWRSSWYTLGAYAVAAGVGAERVIDRHHYPTDVITGAAIGIIATEFGYWLGDKINGRRGLNPSARIDRDFRPNTNFSSLALSTGLSLPLGNIDAGQTHIRRYPALSVAVKADLAVDDSWGIAAEAQLLSTPIEVETHELRTYVNPLTSVGVAVGPYFTRVLSSRLSIGAQIAGGYRKNFGLGAEEDAVRAEGGTPLGRVSMGATWRVNDRLSARAEAGYEISHHQFAVSPSQTYLIDSPGATSGITHSILISFAARYEF